MSDAASASADQAAINRLVRCLDGFAQSLGLDDDATRQISGEVIANMPSRLEEERLAEARTRMLTERKLS